MANKLVSAAPNSNSSRNCITVGLAGAAGLGKSSMSRILKEKLNEEGYSCSHLQLDGFLRPRDVRRAIKTNGYCLSGWDTPTAEKMISRLVYEGENIAVPQYDYDGTVGNELNVQFADFIILDGNYLAVADSDDVIDFSIFFEASTEASKTLRFERDAITERRFSESEAKAVWLEEEQSYIANIRPYREKADAIVHISKKREYFLDEASDQSGKKIYHSPTPLQDRTIFLSYTRQDNEIATATKSFLEKHGARVWIDTASMLAGSHIKESIESAIDNSDAVVLVSTKQSIDSFWLPFEFGYSLGSKTPVFPVLYGVEADDLPSVLSSLNCCTFVQLERVLLPALKHSFENVIQADEQGFELEIDNALKSLGDWSNSPEIAKILLEAVSLDKGQRRIAHIRMRRMPKKTRKRFLDVFEVLLDSKVEHIRGEAYYCLAQILDENNSMRYSVEFFEKGLFDDSDKVKSCCTNLIRHFSPLPQTAVERLKEFVAMGLENEEFNSDRSGMVYWAYVALDAHKSAKRAK
nr:TIR domain-containing protein [Cochlodiniinecator piscidefendens]